MHHDALAQKIELRTDYLSDDPSTPDTKMYFNIGEPLASCGEGEFLPALFFATHRDTLVRFSLSISYAQVLDTVLPESTFIFCLNSIFGVGGMDLPWIHHGTFWEASVISPGWEERWTCEWDDSLDQIKHYSYSILKSGLPAEVLQEFH